MKGKSLFQVNIMKQKNAIPNLHTFLNLNQSLNFITILDPTLLNHFVGFTEKIQNTSFACQNMSKYYPGISYYITMYIPLKTL